MRDHIKLRAFQLADEVRLDSVRAQRLTAFSLQPKHLSSYHCFIPNSLQSSAFSLST